MARNQFSAPIPGMSLTQTPKNAPWENPPQTTDPKEAMRIHVDALMDVDRMEAALFLLENSTLTLKDVVTGIVRSAVANGIHSIDVGLLVSPAIHEFIKQTADTVGVEYEEGLVNKAEQKEAKEGRLKVKALKMARDMPDIDMDNIDMTIEEAQEEIFEDAPVEVAEDEEMPSEELTEAPTQGLMARKGM